MQSTYISETEYRSLAWLASRYDSAEYLTQRTTHRGPEHSPVYVLTIEAADVPGFFAACEDDNGAGTTFVPCLGGPLAEKVRSLLG